MDKEYYCKLCNYGTNRTNDLKKHMLTNSHIIKLEKMREVTKSSPKSSPKRDLGTPRDYPFSDQEKINFIKSNKSISKQEKQKFICNNCKICFTNKSNMYRHKKLHCNKNINDLLKRNEKLEEQVGELVKLANKSADANIINAKSTQKSLSMMKYAIINLSNAPEIKLLEEKDAVGLIEYHKTDKRSVEDLLVFNYQKGLLNKFIGDMIVKIYKKTNPEEQSFWSTDASRLTFIVMQLIKETGENEWATDRSGLKIKKLIIKPLLSEIEQKLHEYVKKCIEHEKNTNDHAKYLEKIISAKEIIIEITQETLHNDVLRYIAVI